ncbi:MAG: 3-phosphoshikimate 1-carboxyvinyltransferase [Rhodospirillaceae bacterium]|nr:3-phosphoshikimate 1-carboxyvinyltransferase [Rhodospirillaceae bacterium]
MTSLVSSTTGALAGTTALPGDKSISHRSLLLGALAVGETVVHGLLEGEDVLNTVEAIRQLGAQAERDEAGVWHIHGVGIGGLREPDQVIDYGNSGTGARLLLGVLAGHPITAFITGDASLCSRPMNRVAGPLSDFGARFVTREGGRLPLAVTGATDPMPITYRLPVASAQVKSAVLLAGLNAPGFTTVIEPEPTRDHTELMLRHFGAEIDISDGDDGAAHIRLTGQPELSGQRVVVPGDPSSAAFPAVAAAISAGSDITLMGIGMNPRRTGLFETLLEMGANIERLNERTEAGEPVADLRIRGGRLNGVEVPPERAPRMIDEYPVLAMAASVAAGDTVMRGVKELRVKESDRLAAVAQGLSACGVSVEEGEDFLIVHGNAGPAPGGGTVATDLDHRIAMSFLVLGAASEKSVTVDDAGPIDTSFPGFVDLMNGLGASIGAGNR